MRVCLKKFDMNTLIYSQGLETPLSTDTDWRNEEKNLTSRAVDGIGNNDLYNLDTYIYALILHIFELVEDKKIPVSLPVYKNVVKIQKKIRWYRDAYQKIC